MVEDGHSSDSQDEATHNPRGAEYAQPSIRSRREHSSFLQSTDAIPTPTARMIEMDIFNVLLQPALEFHLISQSYSRRIGSHDRHHRTRNTVEDEYEVVTACKEFEAELQNLWRQRPRILNLTSEQLAKFVHRDIAKRLGELFSVYMVGFWTHFIYIHRVAWWSLPHSTLVSKAIDETWKMMRRSVGQSADMDEYSPGTTDQGVIHSGLIWPCFLFGCETTNPAQAAWAVAQLKALGELGSRTQDIEEDSGEDFAASRLDKKGAGNALRVSTLLKALVERQTAAGARVDGKYLCQELFGCHFYII